MSSLRWPLKIAAGVLGVALFGVAAYNYFRVYCCAPVHLKLSGGNVCPLRTEMASTICREVHDAGIALESTPGTNSEAICKVVDANQLDLGLVLGGFPSKRFPNIRQVAALGVEPLHLLVRRDMLTSAPLTLAMLRGKRVAMGERGGNNQLLADSVLRFAGLRPSTSDAAGDFTADYSTESELLHACDSYRSSTPELRSNIAEQLPDAVFLLDSLPAELVDDLVGTGLYELVPLPYAAALHLDHRRDHARGAGRLENGRLEAVTIPAFTYGINPPMPAADCPTIGVRLLLVANKKTSAAVVHRLLKALDGSITDRYHVNLEVANQVEEFPLHPGAKAFAKGRRPLMLSELLEPVGDALSVIGAGAAGALALWGFLRGLRAINPDIHLRQIDRIERLLRGDEQDESAPLLLADFIDYLERRLSDVKKAAIEDYAAGRLEGDEKLVSILTLIADTRHLLVQRRKQLGLADSRGARGTFSLPGATLPYDGGFAA